LSDFLVTVTAVVIAVVLVLSPYGASFITLLAVPFATLHIFFDCRLGLVEVGGEQVLVAIICVLLPLLVDGDCVLPAVVCCMVSCGALFI
jgi:hypothetical protein